MKKITLSIIVIIAIITASLLLINQNQAKGKQSKNHPNHNTPPKAKHETFTLDEDTKTYIALKATDVDNDNLTYKITTQPKYGKLKGKANELLTYIPNKDYNGKDSFSFIANDGLADSNETAIDINITPVADLKGLKFSIDATEVNRDTNISYTITPIYDKGKIPKELKELKGLEIVSNIKDGIKVDKEKQIITLQEDGNITLRAKLNNILSNKKTVKVVWEVNGYRLPPEPDPKINNSTLLGIDTNNNGVRDDVERWIYKTYAKMHPINIAIAMEGAKAYQKIIADPVTSAKNYASFPINDCESYFLYPIGNKYYDKYHKIIPKDVLDNYFRKRIIFNTKERRDSHNIYGYSMSGEIFTPKSLEESKKICKQYPNIWKVIEEVEK